ncbi:CBS domain-containing protein [Leifsonia xyli]|uniref:CBS domain-containing protein n=1 Tax=Leifsonia xyli TaxID=1575 RepID=UPI003D67AC61
MAQDRMIVTPQAFTEEICGSDEIRSLPDFLDRVGRGTPWSIPLERLIRLNGNTRRGKVVNQQIESQLRQRGLVCTPAIEMADYYGVVVISDPRDELPRVESVASLPISAFRSELPNLISCGREMTARKVQTLMISYDISQVPVLSQDKKNLYGVITWKSIAQSRADMSNANASDLMGSAGHVASSAEDFLNLVQTIIQYEYMLYRAPDGRIDGIVTASDLAQAFNDSAGVFIQLQEVENRLRILLDRSSIPSLRAHLDPKRRELKLFRGQPT